MNAKEFLEQLQKYEKMIENKNIEREQWKSIALGITSGSKSIIINGVKHSMDKVQQQGEQQKMADAVARYVDIEKEIDHIIDKLVEARFEVIRIIEMLPAVEYNVLHKLYVQQMSYEETAYACGDYSISWVNNMRRKAEKQVQRILDEITKDNKR